MNRIDALAVAGTRVTKKLSSRKRGGTLSASSLDMSLNAGPSIWVLALIIAPVYLCVLLAAIALVKYLQT